MKPYYEHAGITIYHGDCREILPQVGLSCASLVTDPPYGTGGWRREGSGNGSDPSAKLVREPWDTGEVDFLELCRCDTAIVFFPSMRAFWLLNEAVLLGMEHH